MPAEHWEESYHRLVQVGLPCAMGWLLHCLDACMPARRHAERCSSMRSQWIVPTSVSRSVPAGLRGQPHAGGLQHPARRGAHQHAAGGGGQAPERQGPQPAGRAAARQHQRRRQRPGRDTVCLTARHAQVSTASSGKGHLHDAGLFAHHLNGSSPSCTACLRTPNTVLLHPCSPFQALLAAAANNRQQCLPGEHGARQRRGRAAEAAGTPRPLPTGPAGVAGLRPVLQLCALAQWRADGGGGQRGRWQHNQRRPRGDPEQGVALGCSRSCGSLWAMRPQHSWPDHLAASGCVLHIN